MKQDQDTQAMLRRVALRYLTRRDYSTHELTEKLKSKGFANPAIQSLLTELIRTNLINDLRFAENYIRWRRAKGYGPQRIKAELTIRGIAAEMIAELLLITDNAWFVEVEKLWQKRFKSKFPADFKQRAEQMRFLQYRGYTQEQIESLWAQHGH